jgi:hypothetical protein
MLGGALLTSFGGGWFPDWVIGVLLAFGGCTLSNFGLSEFELKSA